MSITNQTTMRQIRRFFGILALVAFGTVPSGRAWGRGLIILDQPHDFVTFSPSEQNTAVGNARTADDFVLEFNDFPFVVVEMIVSFPNAPAQFAMDFYTDDGGQPGSLITTTPHALFADMGPWNGQTDLHLFEIAFAPLAQIPAGRNWVSPYGIGGGFSDQRAFWGTAGNGAVNFGQGQFKSAELGFPDWTGVSHPDLLGFESDFAMRVEIIPAPPAAAALLLPLAIVGRRRRRS